MPGDAPYAAGFANSDGFPMRVLLIAALSGVVAACTAPVSTLQRPDAYYAAEPLQATEASLFSGDAAVLSDAQIATILAYDYSPPELSRIALMPFGRELWSDWSEELAIASEAMQREVIDALRASPRIYDASYLPTILIPAQKTVPHLREAGARYQADLMLVYRSWCRSFERYRIFSADRSRAYCGVEAVLLDTRTGLVPFTSVAYESFEATQNDADFNFRETMLKAQLQATADALATVSAEVVAYLDSP